MSKTATVSKIAEFVREAAQAAEERAPDDMVLVKVTCRIPDDAGRMLDLVAEKVADTRSGLAAELLVRAIEDARAALGLPYLISAEVIE